MRRPFLVPGLSILAALALASWVGRETAIVLAWIFAGIAFCTLLVYTLVNYIRKADGESTGHGGLRSFFGLSHRWALYVALGFFAAALGLEMYSIAWESRVAPYMGLDGVQAHITGEVLDFPEEKYEKYYYQVKAEKVLIDGKEQDLKPFTLRLSANQPFLNRPGDKLECMVVLYRFAEGGLYSGENTRLSKGMVLGGYVADYDSLKVIYREDGGYRRTFAMVRQNVSRAFSRLLPESEASLIRAMLLGESDSLSSQTYSDFRRLGSTHLLVISGLHMAALAAFISIFIKRLPVGRIGRNLLTAGILLCFLATVGFPVSALRSGMMYLIALLADCFGRRADGINSLGFAILVLCLQNPFAGGDLGLALSALATMGILTLYPGIYGILRRPFINMPWMQRAIGPIAASLSVTFSALIGTMPIQLLVFRGIPLLSPIANLILVLPCTLLLYCSFAGAILSLAPVLAPLAAPFIFCGGWLARFALWAANSMAGIRGIYFSLGDSTWYMVLGGVLLIMAMGFMGKWKGIRPFLALTLSLWLVLIGGGYEKLRGYNTVTVAVADQGGESCVVLTKDGMASVLCLGGYNTDAAANLLGDSNIWEISTIYLSGGGADARKAGVKLLETYGADKLLAPQGAYLGKDITNACPGIETGFTEPGQSFYALPGVEVEISQNMNRLSFQVNGVDAIIELGPSGQGHCDILVTGRGDSRINSAFTVLQADDIIRENPEGKGDYFTRDGEYILPPENGWLYMDIRAKGNVEIRRDS